MLIRKKMVGSLGVAVLAIALTITAVVTDGGNVAESEVTSTELEKNGIAGIAVAIQKEDVMETNEAVGGITVEKKAVDVVSNPAVEEEKEGNTQEEAVEEPVAPTQEELEWQDKLMADVKDYLNVRESDRENAKIVGKLRKGDRALVKEQGESWTKIASGNVNGYVKNEYCLFGLEAYAYAKENCDTIATVTTNGLRVRAEANEEAKVVKNVGKGESLVVATEETAAEGWVAVKEGGKICYVSADYVTLGIKTTKAITIEEEKAAKKAANSGLSRGQTTTTSTRRGHTLAATADEETLLAALAECEAGGCGEEAMTAVAAVVINRIHSRTYPNNMYDVIHQRGQFGPASSGRLEQRLSRGPSASARRAARAALAGEDPTGGAIGFMLASSGHAGVVIGPIVFF